MVFPSSVSQRFSWKKKYWQLHEFCKEFLFQIGLFSALQNILLGLLLFLCRTFFGSMSQRFWIGKSFDFHKESDGSSTFSRGEVLPNLFAGRNHKTRCFSS